MARGGRKGAGKDHSPPPKKVEMTSDPSAAAPPQAGPTAPVPPPQAEKHVVSAEVDESGAPYLGSKTWQRMGMPGAEAGKPNGPLEELFTKLYGNLPREERFRVLWLAGTLFFIIGGYWLLRSLKDPIVSTIVGVEYIPKCKMLSLVVVFVLVFVYNKLIDLFPKHQLFYIIGGFYACVFCLISMLLADPEIGIANTNASPDRWLGWVSYCTIESFGSICVSLFWAFVNSSMNLEGAKSAYGLIIAGAQIGSILGPSIAAGMATKIGVAKLYGVGSLCMGMMVIMVWGYVHIFGVPPAISKKEKKSAGMLEGFQLFIKYDYVKGIFAMSCLFMVEVTILDFMMKVLAKATFDKEFPDSPQDATEHFAAFMGFFGQMTNGISFMFSLLGTSMVIRRLGLRRTLVLFPILCLAVVCLVVMAPSLWAIFTAMILLKAFSYSLNNPCKEMLYQPTSTAVKFKSKSWIDIFGARGSKAAGSVVTNAFSDSISSLIHYGGFVAMGVSSFLIYVSIYMGRKFEHYVETEHVVGDEDNSHMPLEELAAQGAVEDTSCGVLEEGQGDEGGPDDQEPERAQRAAV